ncbi:MAG: SAM-dependent methyltransferase [Clostridia bacterium]|nr:SAM-dependent methyltransferase [Clostridia bacterium]
MALEGINEIIAEVLASGAYKIIMSAPRSGDFRRISLNLTGGEYFAEKLTEKQAFHERIPLESAKSRIEALFSDFSQLNAWSAEYEFTAKISKKGKLLAGKHTAKTAPKAEKGPNREKSYLLSNRRVIPPLVDMGVMTADGRIIKSMNDKFRQINRFIELVGELVKDEPASAESPLHIVDFGCGKSYLTFIVYYYFTEIAKRPVIMTGLDLKRDVIDFCASLSEKYGYKNLSFYCGDIADYAKENGGKIDLMISLHACDTATDLALFNAVRFGAKYILSSPCCQHELNKNAELSAFPLFDDGGILRERVCALMTDSIRQKLLYALGYSARVMEFVELSHTPKNLMIRAKKTNIPLEKRRAALYEAEEALSLMKTEQTLHALLEKEGYLSKLKELK